MNNVLQLLWRRADVKDHAIEQAELLALGEANLQTIRSLSLIRQIGDARSILCDDCGRSHLADVVPDHRRRGHFYYRCPEIGRITVSPERLRRWEVAFDRVGFAIGTALSLEGDLLEIALGRIWLLGRRHHGKTTAEVFLLRGAWWPDANEALDSCVRLRQSPDPLVFVPWRFPNRLAWSGARGSIHSLSETAYIKDGTFTIRTDTIDDLRRRRMPAASESCPVSAGDRNRRGKVARSIGTPESVQVVADYIAAKGLDHAGFAAKVGTTGRTIQKFLGDGVVLRRIFNAIADHFKLSTEELLQGATPRRS